jgi:hypothetical protein
LHRYGSAALESELAAARRMAAAAQDANKTTESGVERRRADAEVEAARAQEHAAVGLYKLNSDDPSLRAPGYKPRNL